MTKLKEKWETKELVDAMAPFVGELSAKWFVDLVLQKMRWVDSELEWIGKDHDRLTNHDIHAAMQHAGALAYDSRNSLSRLDSSLTHHFWTQANKKKGADLEAFVAGLKDRISAMTPDPAPEAAKGDGATNG